jgi:hypothetical protein
MSQRYPGRPQKKTEWAQCKAEECERTTKDGSLGFCRTHYAAYRRGMLDLESGKRLRPALRVASYGPGAHCSVAGCGRRPKGDGLCPAHWLRRKNGLDLDAPLRPRARKNEIVLCLVVGCTRRATSRGMCGPHTHQRERGILDGSGKKLREPSRGGRPRRERWKDPYGYIHIYVPEHPHVRHDGTILEHRFVMEWLLGRYLEDWEIVHHKNGNRMDNCPENLVVLDGRARSAEGHPPGSAFCPATAVQVLLQQDDLPDVLRGALLQYQSHVGLHR